MVLARQEPRGSAFPGRTLGTRLETHWGNPLVRSVRRGRTTRTLRDAEERGFCCGGEAAEGAEGGGDGAGFVAAVDHAVAALGIAALVTVGIPVGRLDQLAKRLAVAFAEQIAGPLPAKN